MRPQIQLPGGLPTCIRRIAKRRRRREPQKARSRWALRGGTLLAQAVSPRVCGPGRQKENNNDLKHIESTVDTLAQTAHGAVADAHELSTKTLNEAGGVVAEGKAAANSIAKTVGERIDEAVQNGGEGRP